MENIILKRNIKIIIGVISILGVMVGCGKTTTNKVEPIAEKIAIEESKSNIEFTIEKTENITRNSMGGKVAEISFENPIFIDEKYNFITEDMENEAKLFFENNEDIFLDNVNVGEESDYRDGHFPYYCTSKIKSIYQKERYISVLTEFSWYVGGIGQYDYVGYNYSLDKEIRVDIQTVCDLDTNIIMEKIEKELREYEYYSSEIYMDELEVYTNKEIPFYFDEKGVYTAFPTGNIGAMSAGCIVVPIVEY